ncbi:MAG TPA: STAS domain-containing protein [Solirubrobacterales bacterium]|nr:STAS domain-containing protein [Solirubrobacterales bacterium]
MIQRFEIVETDPRPGYRDIKVIGELDLAVAGKLDEKLEVAMAECERILIGLGGCDFIDSSGIAVILRAHKRMAEQDRNLVVYGPSAQVLRVFEMTGLTANGLVFESAEEALAALGTETSA